MGLISAARRAAPQCRLTIIVSFGHGRKAPTCDKNGAGEWNLARSADRMDRDSAV